MTKSSAVWFFIIFCWLCLLAAISAYRPLMPVDETRYLTVAWEMLVRDAWVLPTLDYAPYSHKPPLLFWLIRSSWEVMGVAVTPARCIIGIMVLSLFFLTGRLAARLFPAEKSMPSMSMLVLAGLPIFLLYASMIMFDTMLAVFVVAGVICIWQAAHTNADASWRPLAWFMVGGAIGLGVLTKGPVALVYILPAALLAPLWAGTGFKNHKARWYSGVVIAILTGAAIGLAWAVPAAIEGGDAYTKKIFLTQSAGRMVNAFDHVQPFWHYVPTLLGYMAPVMVWPAFWRGLSSQGRILLKASSLKAPGEAAATHNAGHNTSPHDGPHPYRFLLCTTVPIFLFFSAISSKQFHYMIPILPMLGIVAALFIVRTAGDTPSVRWPVAFSALPSVLLLGVYVFEVMTGYQTPTITHIMDGFLPWLAVVHIAIVFAALRLSISKAFLRMPIFAGAAFVSLIMVHIQFGQNFLPRYDLERLQAVYAPLSGRPLAIIPKYDGEYGYILRLRAAAGWDVDANHIDVWLAQNPSGVVLTRDRFDPVNDRDYNVLGHIDFRYDQRIFFMEKK